MSSELKSAWDLKDEERYSPLDRDDVFDVVVIGGGIAGLTSAYLLKQAGAKVALLEKHRIGTGETGHTTAHVTMVTDTRLSELEKTVGPERARITWEALAEGIDTIEDIVEREGIDAEFRRVPGYLCGPIGEENDAHDLLSDDKRTATAFGFSAQLIGTIPLIGKPGLCFPEQALFHPRKYLQGLARAVHRDGSSIFEETEYHDATEEHDVTVTANGHQLKCRRLVVATHYPVRGLMAKTKDLFLHTKLAAYNTYAVGGTVLGEKLPEQLVWDTAEPYRYLRIHRVENDSYVIMGGEDHKTGQAEDQSQRYERLEALTRRFIPTVTIDHRWSGQVIETNDGLPYIGPTMDQQFVATGFCGVGMTYGTVAGIMARDWANGRQNPWAEIFSVDRLPPISTAWDYVRENVDFPLHLLKGWLTPAQQKGVEELNRGEGEVLALEGKKVAVARDREGKLHIRSAVCTHLGCIVGWNRTEGTWDCPCHGSRFAPDGSVIAGPAEAELPAVEEHAQK